MPSIANSARLAQTTGLRATRSQASLGGRSTRTSAMATTVMISDAVVDSGIMRPTRKAATARSLPNRLALSMGTLRDHEQAAEGKQGPAVRQRRIGFQHQRAIGG